MSAAWFEVQNPVTGAVIGTVPNSTPDQIRAAVERVRRPAHLAGTRRWARAGCPTVCGRCCRARDDPCAARGG
jgi:acyl-CoA reductase-like NAD-dependent aldehyde dehydrogenase